MSFALTHYHAKYFAHDLTKRNPVGDIGNLASTFAGAKVDLNPHQVDAALFAFQSPLSKGALLADEVGLGKTIEAGLVIAQKWAECRRRILVITPSNLRKQWHQELTEKFFVPCSILEKKSFDEAVKDGIFNPFQESSTTIICSYQFAKNKSSQVKDVEWDLVVIDEAHRLRNVYKPSNVIAKELKRVLKDRHKLLLTATPLQNSLLELFGLVGFIDERVFGNLKSFRAQFSNLNQLDSFEDLKQRLKPICHRTLREEVGAYVSFTKRHPILKEFTPTDEEEKLYEQVSAYLQRENLQALPASQRALTTLVMRKLLASSTFAISKTLETLADRLKKKLEKKQLTKTLADELDEDYEGFEELIEEWDEEDTEAAVSEGERRAIEEEIQELTAFANAANLIEHNAKGEVLLQALTGAFDQAQEYGGAAKAIIFTESRRTQEYLWKLLRDTPWGAGLLRFNGTNNDPESRTIYKNWLQRYQGTDRVSDSKTADMRSALVDYFREDGTIMIATEAGAEGINLQFCSLIINYDLPWNPQRIEQRIGRCHRYGQRYDVVVVNFLNRKNAADLRVYELLDQKFQLFNGVFGSSDEVLGAIEAGVDFEKRIADIYQRCRQPQEIEQAFDLLRQELSLEINETMVQTRRKLLENFDVEVTEKLKMTKANSEKILDRFEKLLMLLTGHELAQDAAFLDGTAFRLDHVPGDVPQDLQSQVKLGLYELPRRSDTAHAYRLGHPLADILIQRAKGRDLVPALVEFNYNSSRDGKVTVLEPLVGSSGELSLSLCTIDALGQTEDHLVFAARLEDGRELDAETAKRLLSLPGQVIQESVMVMNPSLDETTQIKIRQIQQDITERNANFFEQEVKKLDSWADDQKVVLEQDIKEIDRLIKEAKRSAAMALDLHAKLDGQKQVRALERQRTQKRRDLFDAQDVVDQERDKLIDDIEAQLEQKTRVECLFRIRWSLV
jgi:ERCC4-related helicase